MGDGVVLEQVVNYPSVRSHLKSDLRTALETRNGSVPALPHRCSALR